MKRMGLKYEDLGFEYESESEQEHENEKENNENNFINKRIKYDD